MEEIEYLEEYEDLVLPALNSAAAAAASSTSTFITKTQAVTEYAPKSSANDDDGSSSSLDQDIFNCLFDDHSDDDNDYIEKIDDNASLNQKRESPASVDSLDLLVDDLGKQVAKEIALQKVQQEQQNKIIGINAKVTAEPKVTSSTPKTFVSKPSASTVTLIKSRNTAVPQLNKNLPIIKQKSVATVRPTVQNKQLQQRQNTNLIQTTSFVQQQQRPTSSTAKTSSSVKPTTSKSAQLPVLVRKPLSSALSSSTSSAAAASTLNHNKFKHNPAAKPTNIKTFVKRPATIVKPEKIITKDPAEDPLNLDDLSETASDNYSVSDISGETYNSNSDFYEDDEDDYSGDNDEYFDDDLEDDISSTSQIIEISNDSSDSTSNLEDLRASTPSPVISQDQDIFTSSFDLNKPKSKSSQILRNPHILEGLLTKGEKPKLLELINQYAYKNNSSSEEEGEEINEVIDITASRENLVENIPQAKVTIISDTIITPATKTSKQDNKLSATNNTLNPAPSDKNRSKTVKIRISAMENIKTSGRDLKSPGAASDDSYISAVEELLEESYAEAMKKMNDSNDIAVDELLEESYAEAMKKLKESSTLQTQDMGAEIELGVHVKVEEQQKEKKTQTEEDKQKTSKMGIVIEYEDNSLDQKIKVNELRAEVKTTENIQKVTEKEDIKKVETKYNEEDKDKMLTNNSLAKTQPSLSKVENVSTDQPKETANTENKTIAEQSDIKSAINESPNTRKKKRFRNLTSPDPTENEDTQITGETVFDVDEFKGFEDVEPQKIESTPQLKVAKENSEKGKDNITANESAKVSTSSSGSFKSPTKTHKSSIVKPKDKSSRDSSPTKTSANSSDKSRDSSPTKTPKSSSDKYKDTKYKCYRDSSKDSKSSRDSSRESKDKHHKDSSKDRNSRESSKDKNSQERSKDRSRESSKDSSKHNLTETKSTQEKSPHKYTTETSSKKHHKDYRKSRDSKDSSKSRESSKSRDKESKEKKSETKDSHSSSSNVKKDSKTVYIAKDNTDKIYKESSKDIKISKNKEITKQSEESKDKALDKTKDSKDLKNVTEKVKVMSEHKQIENMKKPQDTSTTLSTSGKSLVSPVKVPKSSSDLKEPKDKKDSRDTSKDCKDFSKTKGQTLVESDKYKEIKKSDTSSRESAKDHKDIKNPKGLKDVDKISTQQSKKNPKDSNQPSTSKDAKKANETNTLKDSKLAEKTKEIKSSQDNKNSTKSKDPSKETKNNLSDNNINPKGISTKPSPIKSSNKSTSTLNPSKSTRDVLDKKKNEINPTSIKDPKEDRGMVQVCDLAKNPEKDDSFEIVESKKETKTVVTKSEMLKAKETTVDKPKAKELESGNAKAIKSENILEIATVSKKDTKETKSENITLGSPVIKLTRVSHFKPKEYTKTGEIKTGERKVGVTENKTTSVDNTKMEGSELRESKVKNEIKDVKPNKNEKDTRESKETIIEKIEMETKDGIVEKNTERHKLKTKQGSLKPAEVKSQESKDPISKNLKSQEVSILNEKKLSEIEDKNIENKPETIRTKKLEERRKEATLVTEQTKSKDIKNVLDKKVEEFKGEETKSQEVKTVLVKRSEYPNPMKTKKAICLVTEETKDSDDTKKKIGGTKDQQTKDKSVVLKSQVDTGVHVKNEKKSEPIKTINTIDSISKETKASRDKEMKLVDTKDEENKDQLVELKSQEDAIVHDKNEEKIELTITRKSEVLKSEESEPQEAKTATNKSDGEAKLIHKETKIKPMKTRKSFGPKLEPTSVEIANFDEKTIEKSEENKPDIRKTRNRNDTKTEDQKSKETSDSSEKKIEETKNETKSDKKAVENLKSEAKAENTPCLMETPKDISEENKPEPRKTRNRNDSKTEEQKSKEIGGIAEKNVAETKSKTKSDITAGLDKSKDESLENKPEPRKTRIRHDLDIDEQMCEETKDDAMKKDEETKSETKSKNTANHHDLKIEKSEETSDKSEKQIEENKSETKSEKTVGLVDKAKDELETETKITRNRHDLKTEEQKSIETSDNAEKTEKNKIEINEKTEGLVENQPEPRKTRNRHDSKTEEKKYTQTNDNTEKTIQENKSELKSEKTTVLMAKAKDKSAENKPEPRATRNRHDSMTEEQNSTETTDNVEKKDKNKSEITADKTLGLTEKAKLELVENKPELRKTRNRHELKSEEEKSKEISKTKTEKTAYLEKNAKEESVEYKPELRKTRNRHDSSTEEQKPKETVGNKEKKVGETKSETKIEETESLENKLEPIKNTDKKVEKNKSENKSEDYAEKNIFRSEENKPEPRKTRNRHDSKTEDHKTSGNLEKQVEENTSNTKFVQTACLTQNTKDESVENKPEPRKTRSQHDSRSEEQKSVESSQNPEKTIKESNIETSTDSKSDESEKKGTAENNKDQLQNETIETKKVKDQKEDLNTSQIKDDKILNTEKDISAYKKVDSKEPVSKIVNTENLEKESITETTETAETGIKSIKDANETPTREKTPKPQRTKSDFVKDNISVISNSSSISTTTSISSSDTPIRRTLRKRGTESPFPENDNKKIFKEPPPKSTMGTPKTAKNEKTSTDVVSPSSTTPKRNLRSPASDADTSQNLTKKPRLESPGRKSARFRNLNDDCLEEVELPVVTVTVNDSTSEKEIVRYPTSNTPVVSQSPRKSIRPEIPEDKNSEQVQEPTDKIRDVKKTENVFTKDKSQKQGKESAKTFNLEIEQAPKKLLLREVINIEAINETSNQSLVQQNLTLAKPNVSTKKSLRSEEVKNPSLVEELGDEVKVDSAENLETEPPLKKLLRGEVIDIEAMETDITETVNASSQSLAQEDLSTTIQNVNAKNVLVSEEVQISKKIQNVVETPDLSTIEKTPIKETLDRTKTKKVLTPPNKSPGSVLSFSDWLKNKTQTDAAGHEVISIPQQTATEDISKVEPRRRSRMKAKKLTSTKTTEAHVETKESIVTHSTVQKEAILPTESEHFEKDASLLNILNNTSNTEQEATVTDSIEMEQTTLKDDNSLLEPALNQITERENPKKQRGRPFGKLKARSNIVKRIKRPTRAVKKQKTIETTQELQQLAQGNITDNVTTNEDNKSNTSIYKSNSMPKQKTKRSERELLIESMSKEMKEGGIQDLLNVDNHVKRQRLASRKRLASTSTEQLNTTITETVDARISSDVFGKESLKVVEFLDMPDVAPKSPTKRQALTHHNVTKTKKSKDTSIKDIINDDGLSEEVAETSVIKDVSHAKISKPITVETNNEAVITRKVKPPKKSAIHREKEILKEFQTTQNISDSPIPPAEIPSSSKQITINPKSRKSLPAPTLSQEGTTVIKSRKSMGSVKQPINEEQTAMNKMNRFVNKVNTDVFKTPKTISHSIILNKIPPVENIMQLYTDTNKRSQSRNMEKSKHYKNLAAVFKCRKLRVRLNRSVAKRYWKSLKLPLISATSTEKAIENLHSAKAVPFIQHNKETNLRIQSVVSAANVLSEPLECSTVESVTAQDSVCRQLIPQNTASSTIESQPYFVPNNANETQSSTSFMPVDSGIPLELKYEFVEENPKNIENSVLPDTPTLLARAQTITQAAQHALSNSTTPTDIRLLTTESSANAYVSSFGVAPTVLNNKGTCLYTFLHPAKYNRNHSNVLLDFCCPNLDGPMPAIDPTRIHSQVQTPVIELPACIVLTTKVVTRAELESKTSTIPAFVRKKAERIRSSIAAHHNIASSAPTLTVTQSTPPTIRPTTTQPYLAPPPRLQPQPQLSSTINALAKHLPSTTTITPKLGPTQHQPSVVHQPPTVSVTAKEQPGVRNTISSYVLPLRSNLRRFDVLQKQLCQPFNSLTFVDRHRIIESIINSGKLSPQDLERTLVLMEEYLTQISMLKSQTKNIYTIPAQNSDTTLSSLNQMPQLQPAPNILASSSSSAHAIASNQLEQLRHKSVRQVQQSNRNTSLTPNRESGEIERRHVPIYDTDRNIIGYQLQPMSAKPAYTKSTMSSRTSGGIMSTSLENQITAYSISKRPITRPTQESPRVFYTTPPLRTSTPIAANPHIFNTNPSSSKALAQKTHQHKGSIVTTVRSSGGSNQSGSSETITTTTMATVKRVTRSTATGSKIIIVSKSNQSSEETILPDVGSSQAETAEIKNENDMEDFIG